MPYLYDMSSSCIYRCFILITFQHTPYPEDQVTRLLHLKYFHIFLLSFFAHSCFVGWNSVTPISFCHRVTCFMKLPQASNEKSSFPVRMWQHIIFPISILFYFYICVMCFSNILHIFEGSALHIALHIYFTKFV